MTRSRFPVLLLAFALCGVARAQMDAYGLAARVNGVGISNEALERSFQEYMNESGMNIAAIRYPERVKLMKHQTLDLLVDQELAWQDSMRAEFTSEEHFLRRLTVEGYTPESYREHIRHLVSAKKYLDGLGGRIEVSDAEVHEFYTANPEKMRMPEAIWNCTKCICDY